MNKRRKAKRKRWMQARVKAYQREKFVEAFRGHFVKKGIL